MIADVNLYCNYCNCNVNWIHKSDVLRHTQAQLNMPKQQLDNEFQPMPQFQFRGIWVTVQTYRTVTLEKALQRGPWSYSIYKHSKIWIIDISRFSVSGAHAHWVGSTDTPSHAIKELKMR